MHFRLCCLLSTEEKLCARELVHDTQTEPWKKQSVKNDHVANIPFFNFIVLAVESSFNRTSWPCSITLLSNYRIAQNPTLEKTSAWCNVILWLALVILLIGTHRNIDCIWFFVLLFLFSTFFPGKLLFTDEIGLFFFSQNWRMGFLFSQGQSSVFFREKCCVMRQKRLGCVYKQDLSSWLLANQRGVFGGADVTKFLEGSSRLQRV